MELTDKQEVVKSTTTGRPSKYNNELQEQADLYIYEYESLGDVVPSRAGLCCYIGIARSTSFEWESTYPLFSDTLKTIDVLQENKIINKGLTGVFNSTITKLMLANHGYSDKVEQMHTSPDGSMSPKEPVTLNDFYASDS